ncbi:MAG: hypothetical protein V9G29_00745 [Burkholderiaceae bacterium]
MATASREGIYRRMSVRMWGDERFMRLSPMQPSGQSLWVYALSGPHTGPIPGVFVAGRAALAEALAWDSEDFCKAFDEVLREGLAEFDPKTRLWFIPKAIHHNMPPNPNVVLSWRQTWALLPESDLRERVFECLGAALYGLSEAFGKAFDEACGKPFDKAMPNGMAKQEQEQDKKKCAKRSGSVGTATPPGFEEFWNAYPKRKARADAIKAFAKLRPDAELLQTMLAAIEAQASTEGWRKDGGTYIPLPATWLNGQRWLDEVQAAGQTDLDEIFRRGAQ